MGKSSPQFQRPEGRADFERAVGAVRGMLADSSPDDVMKAIARVELDLDDGVHRVKAGLLGSVLCWKPDDRTLSAWIYERHCELAELARRGADIFERRAGSSDERTLRLIALAFLHWGEAAKWVVGRRERYDYGWMHWLMRSTMRSYGHRRDVDVRLDTRSRRVTIEALFLRTLLLDRFAGGNLTRQQIEVLDAWLWEWSVELTGHDAYPGGAVLRADLDGKGGLRPGRRRDEGPVLYLPVAPLEARRQAVIREFHRGRIVPSFGIAADFRVEEHVAVLEALHSLFRCAQQEEEVRDRRMPTPSSYVEVSVGLGEILARGLNADAASGTGLRLAASTGATTMEHRLRRVQFADENESARRTLRLTDSSETGFGLEAPEKDAMGIGVGDLVGLRLPGDEACVVGRIVRRMPGQTEGQVTLGVDLLSRDAQPLTLARSEPQGRPDDEDEYIYVPGGEQSGSHDAFLVPEKLLHEGTPREARIGENVFTIRFNRVRRKGRGWALAGFEILDAKRVVEEPQAQSASKAAANPLLDTVAPAAPRSARFDPAKTGAYPRFELGDEDPFRNELSARLL